MVTLEKRLDVDKKLYNIYRRDRPITTESRDKLLLYVYKRELGYNYHRNFYFSSQTRHLRVDTLAINRVVT